MQTDVMNNCSMFLKELCAFQKLHLFVIVCFSCTLCSASDVVSVVLCQ